MKYIQLTNGKQAIVDDDDFEYVNQWKWYCDSRGYATRSFKKDGRNFYLGMHRFINETPQLMLTDHINHNRLDNRKSNLRTCNRSQNGANAKRVPKSGHKGVYKTKNGTWQAQITVNQKRISLGTFIDILEASTAYKDAASQYFGEFAYS